MTGACKDACLHAPSGCAIVNGACEHAPYGSVETKPAPDTIRGPPMTRFDLIHALLTINHLFSISVIFQYVRYVSTRGHLYAAGHIPFETP